MRQGCCRECIASTSLTKSSYTACCWTRSSLSTLTATGIVMPSDRFHSPLWTIPNEPSPSCVPIFNSYRETVIAIWGLAVNLWMKILTLSLIKQVKVLVSCWGFSLIFSKILLSLFAFWLIKVWIIFFFKVPFLFFTVSSSLLAAGFPIPMLIKSSVVT